MFYLLLFMSTKKRKNTYQWLHGQKVTYTSTVHFPSFPYCLMRKLRKRSPVK